MYKQMLSLSAILLLYTNVHSMEYENSIEKKGPKTHLFNVIFFENGSTNCLRIRIKDAKNNNVKLFSDNKKYSEQQDDEYVNSKPYYNLEKGEKAFVISFDDDVQFPLNIQAWIQKYNMVPSAVHENCGLNFQVGKDYDRKEISFKDISIIKNHKSLETLDSVLAALLKDKAYKEKMLSLQKTIPVSGNLKWDILKVDKYNAQTNTVTLDVSRATSN